MHSIQGSEQVEALFEEIRSFRDDEVQEVIQRLIAKDEVKMLLSALLKKDDVTEDVKNIQSVYDFQHTLMYPIFLNHILPTFSEISSSGIEHLHPSESYLFISNHRDIVLDSALLNYFLHLANFQTAEIAIGDNLLDQEWIKDLVRLNKSFIVKRNLDNMEMLRASRLMSKYIYHTLTTRKQSVWIAQRAGRAKDGNDETYRGLINMLYMSSQNGLVSHFKSLKVVPVSISYEFDPCDGRKANELYRETEDGDYVKSANEDVESMQLGIVLPKGKGHLHFGDVIDQKLDLLSKSDKKSDIITGICNEIDQQIQENYKMWPSNYIAHELRDGVPPHDFIDDSEREAFKKRMDEALSEVSGDRQKLEDIFLSMYELPLLNQRKWRKNSSPVS